MKNEAPLPKNEKARLEALLKYTILDTGFEEEFDTIAKLASYICQTPIALISFLDEERQWFKSRVGFEAEETARTVSFCQYTIMGEELFEVPNSLDDAVFKTNPLVTGFPNIRFYAGIPIISPFGYNLGTLCVMDHVPRELSEEQKEALKTLSKQVISQMQLRQKKNDLKNEMEKLTRLQSDVLQADLLAYKEALDKASIVASIDQRGIISSVNDKFCAISKFSKEELIGKDYRIVSSGFHSRDFNKNIWRTIINGETWKGEIKNKAKDSTLYWVDTTIVPMKDLSGKLKYYLVIQSDITKRKALSEKLLIESKIISILAENNSVEITINKISEHICRHLNWDMAVFWKLDFSQNVLKAPFISNFGTKNISAFEEATKNIKFSKGKGLPGRIWQDEKAFCVLDIASDRNFPVAKYATECNLHGAFGFPVFSNKDFIGVIVFFSSIVKQPDSTLLKMFEGLGISIGNFLKRKEAEDKIILYRDIVQNMNTGLFVWKLDVSKRKTDFILMSTNKAATRFTNYDSSDKIGKNMSEIFPNLLKTDLAEVYKNIALGGPSAQIGEFFYMDENIEPGYFSINAFPLPNYSVGVFFENITERKKTQIELVHAKEVAEQAVYAKDSFLANMSHEIRTPMNAIIGFTDLLAQSALNEKQLEFVRNVKNAGDSLLSIINDILDLSKIESGKLNIESHPFSIREILKNVQNLLRNNANEKNLDYDFFLDADLPECVLGDNVRLNQILINLIGNAIKFTEKGSVAVFVKKISENENSYKLQFSVKDTGIGIPSDKLKDIFERFTQANNGTTRKFGGTGLGLNIVQSLIELQGGEIKVKSEEDRGSEFIFSVDYGKADPSLLKPTEKVPAVIKPFGKLKLLLCEDNILNQRLAQNVIFNFGFELDIANNGKEGIELIKTKKYDLVLMDLQMPEMDGYQATLFIRNELKLDIPIVAMTAHSLIGEKEKCLEIGMNEYLAKPFKQEELYHSIISNLSQKSQDIGLPEEGKISEAPISSSMTNLISLNELSCGKKDFEKEIIELFISKIPAEIDLLEQALNEKAFFEVRSLAHKLQPSVAIMGLDDFRFYLMKLEKEAKNEHILEESKSEFKKMKSMLTRCYQELNQILIADYC